MALRSQNGRLPSTCELEMDVFESATVEAFDYLFSELGFQIADRSPNSLTYHGNGCFVIIRHDSHRSYELTLDLGKEGQPSPMFNFGEALRSCGAPADLPSSYQISDDTKLPMFLEKLADNLRNYCSDLLLGNAQAFQRLQQLREWECEAFGQERDLRYARDDANQAWAVGNYGKVVTTLQPHENLLSKSEKIKLELARKKVSNLR